MNVRPLAKGEWEKKANKRTRQVNPVYEQIIALVKEHGAVAVDGIETAKAAKTMQSNLAALGRRGGIQFSSSYSAETKELLIKRREA